MKLLFLSAHAFLPSTRKAGIHFISEALAARGHLVSMVSVGYSLLTWLKDSSLYKRLASEQRNRLVEQAPRYRAGCYLSLLHPYSSGRPWLDRSTSAAFRLYGSVLPRFLRDEVAAADVVLLESGTAICFFDAIRRANPNARIIYFRRDRLDTVGASTYLLALERRLALECDLVSVNSPQMAAHLPTSARLGLLPQGLRKTSFDQCTTSPYPAGSRNGIVVGDMLFDREAMAAMARHNPGVTFHLFGKGLAGHFTENVICHGEQPFEHLVPYIKFADFGITPYRMTEKERYLAESSLKIQQYSYCRLPILAPDLLSGMRDNIIPYKQHGEDDWVGVVSRALAAQKKPVWSDGIMSWDDVAVELETQLAALNSRVDTKAEERSRPGSPIAMGSPLRLRGAR